MKYYQETRYYGELTFATDEPPIPNSDFRAAMDDFLACAEDGNTPIHVRVTPNGGVKISFESNHNEVVRLEALT